MGRFETELLATDQNLAALTELSGQWVDRVHGRRPPKMIILDMDSSVSPTHGEQEAIGLQRPLRLHLLSSPVPVQPVWWTLNGVPFASWQRPQADGWRDVLEPVVERYRERDLRRYFRGMPPSPSDIYEFLEAGGFCMRSACQRIQILQERHRLSAHGRPGLAVRPGSRYDASFSYQAGSWNKSRRVVAKVEWHPGGTGSPFRLHRQPT